MNFDPNDFQDLAELHKIRQLSEINKKLGPAKQKGVANSDFYSGVILLFGVLLFALVAGLSIKVSNHISRSYEENETYLPVYDSIDTNNIYEKEKSRLLELSAGKQNDEKTNDPKGTTAKPKDEDPAAKSERELDEIRRRLGITPSR